jgi:hypothetical protein
MLSFFEDNIMMISGLRREDVVKGEGRRRSFKICILQSDD